MLLKMCSDMIKMGTVPLPMPNLPISVSNNILDKWLFKDFIEKDIIQMELAD